MMRLRRWRAAARCFMKTDQSNYKRHVFMRKGPHRRGSASLGKFPCPRCPVYCKTEAGLKQHTRLLHERNTSDSCPDPSADTSEGEHHAAHPDILPAGALLCLGSAVLATSVRRFAVDAPGAFVTAFSSPISIIEGISLNMAIFSPSFLKEHHGATVVEIRRQRTAAEPD